MRRKRGSGAPWICHALPLPAPRPFAMRVLMSLRIMHCLSAVSHTYIVGFVDNTLKSKSQRLSHMSDDVSAQTISAHQICGYGAKRPQSRKRLHRSLCQAMQSVQSGRCSEDTKLHFLVLPPVCLNTVSWVERECTQSPSVHAVAQVFRAPGAVSAEGPTLSGVLRGVGRGLDRLLHVAAQKQTQKNSAIENWLQCERWVCRRRGHGDELIKADQSCN